MATYILDDIYEIDIMCGKHVIRETTHSVYQITNLSPSKEVISFLEFRPRFLKMV
jgi:hypothetical protein